MCYCLKINTHNCTMFPVLILILICKQINKFDACLFFDNDKNGYITVNDVQ